MFPDQLLQFAKTLFSSLVPSLSTTDLLIDRIHRLPNPSFLPPDVPKDVLLRIHFFHVKEKTLSASRQTGNLPAPYSFYAVAPRCIATHPPMPQKPSNSVQSTKIMYRWKYPATLSVTHNGRNVSLTTMEEGMQALRQWGILPDPPLTELHRNCPYTLLPDWQVVSRKRSSNKNTNGVPEPISATSKHNSPAKSRPSSVPFSCSPNNANAVLYVPVHGPHTGPPF